MLKNEFENDIKQYDKMEKKVDDALKEMQLQSAEKLPELKKIIWARRARMYRKQLSISYCAIIISIVLMGLGLIASNFMPSANKEETVRVETSLSSNEMTAETENVTYNRLIETIIWVVIGIALAMLYWMINDSSPNNLAVDILEEKCKNLEIDLKKTEIEQLKERVQKKETDVEQLEEVVRQKEREIKQLKEAVYEKETEIKQLKETIQNKEMELKKLKKKIKKQTEKEDEK